MVRFVPPMEIRISGRHISREALLLSLLLTRQGGRPKKDRR